MSSKKYVTTISGKEVLIEKTKKFNKQYYLIGDNNIENSGDCYLLGDGKYYRFETGLIVFDHTLKTHVIKAYCNNLIHGIVGANDQLGYFSQTFEMVECINLNGDSFYAMSRDIFKNDLNYRERLNDGKFIHIKRLRAKDFIKILQPNPNLKQSLPYDSHNLMDHVIDVYNEQKIEVDENSANIGAAMQKYTFGLEFETTAGFIPKDLCYKNGLMPLRDGSITGLEFVTIPLQGERGIQTVKNAVNILKERTKFDDQCSLHLHIGNIPRTKEFILAFTIVTLHIQNSIFELFPLYKKYNFGYKNKNYSAPYPAEQLFSELDSSITKENINKNFNVIFQFLSEGAPFEHYGNDLTKIMSHPNNPSNNQKWNIHTRYFIHNLIPLIFGNKQTIEFRIHTPTYDIDKILAFMLMNVSIISYVEKYQDKILKGVYSLNLQDIIYEMMNKFKLADHLNIHILHRKKQVFNKNRNSDIFYSEDTISCDFNKFKTSSLFGSIVTNKSYYHDPFNEYRDQSLKTITKSKPLPKSKVSGSFIKEIEEIYKSLNKSITTDKSINFEPVTLVNIISDDETIGTESNAEEIPF